MRIILEFIIIFVLIFVSSCKKEDDTFVNATIEGYDFRLCACCGGLLVKPSDLPGEVYQWYQKNQRFDISQNDTFPIHVKIKYHHLAETCIASSGEIEITSLEK